MAIMKHIDTVIVVENDPEQREVIRSLLAARGVSVVLTCDGQEALSYLADHDLPSLILLDFHMPKMDGFQFRALQLKDDRLRSVPVVFMTAVDHIPDQNDELKQLRCLKKPFGIEKLLDAVGRHVATPMFQSES
jgi:CheY-like chemotaxis protein